MASSSNSKDPKERNIFSTLQINTDSDDAHDVGLESEDYESDDSEEYIPPPNDDRDSSDSDSTGDGEECVEESVSDEGDAGVGSPKQQNPAATASASVSVDYEDMDDRDLAAKDGTTWSAHEPASKKTPAVNIFKGQQCAAYADTPTEAFELFFVDELLDKIVEHTNTEGQEVFRNSRHRWNDTDRVEIRAVMAALLAIGAQNQGMIDLKTIFSEIWGIPFVRSLFSQQRFEALMTCLRFDNKEDRSQRKAKDALAPIREVFDLFEKELRKHYTPGPFLTVDEQLVPFRGRCKFRIYIPSKPDKYGLKIYWLCEAGTAYPLKALPYTGKTGRLSEKDHAQNVVLKLVEPFFRTGRNITFDNFFTDLKLCTTLLKSGLTSVGTVRKNKKFIPDALKHEKMQKKTLHSSKFAFNPKASIVTYKTKPNKCVTLLSTMHADKNVTGEKSKPDVVLFYNSTKGGVDGMDQMAHKFSAKRKTKRWPVVYFTNILDVAAIAALVIFRTAKPNDPLVNKNARAGFIRSVACGLGEDQLCRRRSIPTLSHFLRETIELTIETLGASKTPRKRGRSIASTPPSTPKGNKASKRKQPSAPCPSAGKKKQQRCSLCPWKADKKVSSQCDKCSKYICPQHKKCVCPDC